jgi:predicted Zn-dependent protease
MKKAYFAYLVATPLALLSSTALAGEPVDNYASAALVKADYATAIARLEPVVARDPLDEIAVLNLAMAYRNTGKASDARRLYKRILFRENVLLDTQTGLPIWSHDVANKGLAMIPQYSAR